MLKFIFGFIAIASLSACSSMPTQSTVKYPVGDREAVVAVGDQALNPGDRIGIFSEKCTEQRRSIGPIKDAIRLVCTKDRLASGEVTNIMTKTNEAIVSAPSGMNLYRGLIVIKE